MTILPEVNIDLRARLGPVRDQGRRPTCLAFAASDSHAGLRDGWEPLSCEFAFFHAQRRAGRSPAQGATLVAMLDALRGEGQPCEAGWPYLDDLPVDAADWAPPASVGACFGRGGVVGGGELARVCAAINDGLPIMLLLMLSRSFFMPVNGVVDAAPDEAPQPSQRHALVAVGLGRVLGMPATLVRNSWGAQWGIDGHAWLTDRFRAPRLFATATLMEEVDVSSRPIAA